MEIVPKIKVSVIIPTYNRSDYLKEAVMSIVDQTISPFEIIVINDGSDYDVDELLVDFKSKVTVINKENGGKPTAVNLGVKSSTGTHIWVFDDDDIALLDYLEQCIPALENSKTDYVFGWHFAGGTKNGGGIEETAKRIPHMKHNADIFIRSLEGCSIAHNAIIADKACYTALSGIDSSYPCSEDYEFQLRLSKLYSGEFIDTPSFYRRIHDGERGRANFKYEARERRQKFVEQDQRFILHHLQTLNIEDYATCESAALTDVSEKRRFLYIEKMYIAARVGLWQEFNSILEEMFNDEMCVQSSLSKDEKKLIRIMLAFADDVVMKPFYSTADRLKDLLENYEHILAQDIRNSIRSGLLRGTYSCLQRKQIHNAFRSFKQYVLL